MNHIDQEAELYALGMLDDSERTRIDDHLTGCVRCTAVVGKAEAAVAALIDWTQERRPQRRTAWWPIAAAAAFAVTAAGLLGQNVIMRGALGTDGTLLATMVDSHFDHAQFQGPGGVELPAKAIYERHGKWYEILADGTPAWHVVFVRPDGTRDPAGVDFARRGSASIVYLAPSTPVHAIDLEDAAGHVVGTVRPTLQAEQE
jgi:Putative zinc-finger